MTHSSINERLKILVNTLDLKIRTFSHEINVSEATTRNYLDRGSKPSSEYLEKIVRRFERVNPIWLLTGDGEILLNQTAEERAIYNTSKNGSVNSIGTNHGTASQSHSSGMAAGEKPPGDLEVENERLRQENSRLLSQLADKERIILLLEMQLKK
ncbi:hypothetical protein [Hymenobacter algoricola]|uniref:XRE family transcriptional regulator n=1 Tax=Hymenobacter algoricola TaxID=486267 RepID=A0ABP7NTD2_9BACT